MPPGQSGSRCHRRSQASGEAARQGSTRQVPAGSWKMWTQRRPQRWFCALVGCLGSGARGMSAGLSEETHSVAASVAAELPADRSAGNIALAIVAVGWAAILALILQHSIYVSHDSISNYGHVWYV